MKLSYLTLPVIVTFCSYSYAQFDTTFNDASGTDNLITNAGNWSSGLPTGGNTGEIGIDAGFDTNITLTGYNITHSAGEVSRNGGLSGLRVGSGSTWLMDGASASTTGFRGLIVLDGGSFTLDNGTGDFTNNNRDSVVDGNGFNSTATINGGTFSVGRDLIVADSATFTMNGGIMTISDEIFSQGFSPAASGIVFNGGTTTATRLHIDNSSVITFGGSTAGSLQLTDTFQASGSNATLNFLAGSQMQLTVNGADQSFYEGLFTGGNLLYEGSGGGAFSDNFQVSGETLTLIPEPSTFAMIAVAGLATMLTRLRRR